MQSKFVLLLYCAAALAPLAAAAQQQGAKPNPADPGAAVPAVTYDSAFAGYAPYRDETLAPWREVNDEVARGHAGIARGTAHGGNNPLKPAAKPSAAGTAPSPQAAPPTPHGAGQK